MGLIIETKGHVGELVTVTPQYGYGWVRYENSPDGVPVDYQIIQAAGIFGVRIIRFFSFKGELRGFCGKVEMPGQMFDGLWVICSTRTGGDFDFEKRVCPGYDVQLGSAEPDQAEWPKIPQQHLSYAGYGSVKAQNSV